MSIVPKLIYHAATRLRGESTVFHHLATMRGVQTMSASDIERRQAEKLLWLLNFARTNVPYYRDLALAAPAARGSAFTALQEWPLLEKSALQRMPDRLR